MAISASEIIYITIILILTGIIAILVGYIAWKKWGIEPEAVIPDEAPMTPSVTPPIKVHKSSKVRGEAVNHKEKWPSAGTSDSKQKPPVAAQEKPPQISSQPSTVSISSLASSVRQLLAPPIQKKPSALQIAETKPSSKRVSKPPSKRRIRRVVVTRRVTYTRRGLNKPPFPIPPPPAKGILKYTTKSSPSVRSRISAT